MLRSQRLQSLSPCTYSKEIIRAAVPHGEGHRTRASTLCAALPLRLSMANGPSTQRIYGMAPSPTKTPTSAGSGLTTLATTTGTRLQRTSKTTPAATHTDSSCWMALQARSRLSSISNLLFSPEMSPRTSSLDRSSPRTRPCWTRRSTILKKPCMCTATFHMTRHIAQIFSSMVLRTRSSSFRLMSARARGRASYRLSRSTMGLSSLPGQFERGRWTQSRGTASIS